jgi:uncharacterized Tic20 family protein
MTEPPLPPPPPPAGPGAPPPGYANNDEKTWALIAHFGGIIAGFIAPLVALLAKGNESPTVKAHATEALNFQITWGAIAILGWILGVCGSIIIVGAVFFVVPFIAWAVIIIFSIIAGLKANEGQFYRYPATVRLVK